jgi:hypothetical protein
MRLQIQKNFKFLGKEDMLPKKQKENMCQKENMGTRTFGNATFLNRRAFGNELLVAKSYSTALLKALVPKRALCAKMVCQVMVCVLLFHL